MYHYLSQLCIPHCEANRCEDSSPFGDVARATCLEGGALSNVGALNGFRRVYADSEETGVAASRELG